MQKMIGFLLVASILGVGLLTLPAASANCTGVQEYVPGGTPPYACAGEYNDPLRSCTGLFLNTFEVGPVCAGLA